MAEKLHVPDKDFTIVQKTKGLKMAKICFGRSINICIYLVSTSTLDTVHIFSFNSAQCSLFWGMYKGQEFKFLAVFDLLYSSSGPQKPQHKSGQKFIRLGAKNKMTMFYHVKRCLYFHYIEN